MDFAFSRFDLGCADSEFYVELSADVSGEFLRTRAGGEAYSVGFIEYYVTKMVYPEITPQIHMAAGILLIVFNLAIYIFVLRVENRS